MVRGPSDTDPSTPFGAEPTRRVATQRLLPVEPTEGPPRSAGEARASGATHPAGGNKHSTDPGVAPPPTPPPVTVSPVVHTSGMTPGSEHPTDPDAPASIRNQRAVVRGDADTDPGPIMHNDSVDVLLDGITGPRPDKVKTLPTSAGAAAAAYGTSHRPQPKHDTPPVEPSVVIQQTEPPVRPRSSVPTVKVSRGALDTVRPSSREQPTVVLPRSSGRLYLAIGGVAVAIVLALLVMGRLWANRVKAQLPGDLATSAQGPAAEALPSPASPTDPGTRSAHEGPDVPPPPAARPTVEAPDPVRPTAPGTGDKPSAARPEGSAPRVGSVPPSAASAPAPQTAPHSSKIDRDYRLGE